MIEGGRDALRRSPGWSLIKYGFGLLLISSLVDITDNFPQLNQFVILGNTQYQSFLEKIVGSMGGFLLLALGFRKWLPVVAKLDAPIFLPLDGESDGEMEAVFKAVENGWGKLGFLLHSIAFCPKEDLNGPVSQCSRAGFAQAMDVSVHALIRMARLAVPLMKDGGSILTMSYYGADKVVDNYNIMGPVKSALEGTVRYLAAPAPITRVLLRESTTGSVSLTSPGGSITRPPVAGTASKAACRSGYSEATITADAFRDSAENALTAARAANNSTKTAGKVRDLIGGSLSGCEVGDFRIRIR